MWRSCYQINTWRHLENLDCLSGLLTFCRSFFVPAPFVNGTSRHVLWAIIAITWPFLGPKLKPHQVFFFLRDTNKNVFKGAFSTKRIT